MTAEDVADKIPDENVRDLISLMTRLASDCGQETAIAAALLAVERLRGEAVALGAKADVIEKYTTYREELDALLVRYIQRLSPDVQISRFPPRRVKHDR